MIETHNETTIPHRYARAAEHTAVAMAAGTPGNLVDGYWLDNGHFFYLAEHFETSLGRILTTPAVADTATGQTGPVITLEALGNLLSGHSDQAIDVKALANATFDMTDVQHLVVTLERKAYHVDLEKQSVTSIEALLELPELYSPDGRQAIFLKGNDIWLRDRESGVSRALTSDGEKHFAYGQTSMSRQKLVPSGLWSPDSQWFVTQRVDERTMPQVPLVQHAPPGGGRPVLHTYPYPMPDDPIPPRTYVAFHIPSGRTITIDPLPDRPLPFMPFFSNNAWFSAKSDFFYFLLTERYQSEFDLVEINLATGARRVMLTEKAASGYISLHAIMSHQPNVQVLTESNEVIWFSERDGWGHLYLYDATTGALKNQITKGEWLVRDIIYVDRIARRILFLAGGIEPNIDPGNRQLCSIDFDGNNLKILLTNDGDVSVRPWLAAGFGQDRPFRPPYAPTGASPDGRHVVARRSSIEHGSQTSVVDLESGKEQVIASVDEALVTKGTAPRRFEVMAADNVTRLYGAMFLPADFDETKRYPVIDYIYPGPQIAMMPRSFRYLGPQNAGQAEALAELGFIVVMVDSRGVPLRSRAFHQIGYGYLLEPQLSDHAAVIEQLCQRYPFMDRERVGVIGFSGGGFATARALFDYPNVFKVGVSVCGNHDNRYYNAYWLEKYSGSQVKNTWEAQSNPSAAHKLQGKLLLIHGDMDDNVHVSHTMGLADALIKANKDFDLLVVPNEEHILLLTSAYVQRRVWDFLVRNLMGEIPPNGFELKYEPRDVEKLRKMIPLESSYA